jgi:ArsR family transcriptional regulator
MTEMFALQARLCQTMGHAARLQIVHHLRAGPASVSDLAQVIGLSPSSLSRHCAALRDIGLLLAQRQGQRVVYRLASPAIVTVCDSMRAVLAEQVAHYARLARSAGQLPHA